MSDFKKADRIFENLPQEHDPRIGELEPFLDTLLHSLQLRAEGRFIEANHAEALARKQFDEGVSLLVELGYITPGPESLHSEAARERTFRFLLGQG